MYRSGNKIYDCANCELMAHLEGLWPENREAWYVFNQLCGRTVNECQAKSWLIDRITETWDSERVTALLARLDVIYGVLSPNGPTQD